MSNQARAFGTLVGRVSAIVFPVFSDIRPGNLSRYYRPYPRELSWQCRWLVSRVHGPRTHVTRMASRRTTSGRSAGWVISRRRHLPLAGRSSSVSPLSHLRSRLACSALQRTTNSSFTDMNSASFENTPLSTIVYLIIRRKTLT